MTPFDVSFEDQQAGFTSGAVDAGIKMTDVPKPAAPTPAAPKSGDAGKPDNGTPSVKPVDIGWPQSSEDAQRMIDRLMASPKFRADYANQNNPERAKLVEGITQLYKLANPEPGEERQPESQVEDTPLQGLRDWTGVQHPDLGGVKYDENDERNWLSWVASENIPTATAQAMTEWYGTRAVLSGWAFREEDYQDFRVAFTGKLRPDQIETLIRWHKEEIMPAQRQQLERMRAQRAGERS